ncbi:MAG: tetratricopeptide repeat protein [Deltaproteobacteria bacterium]|nr:tetratricopeptide repeat protein [Deltaproteobacteria bacterium]
MSITELELAFAQDPQSAAYVPLCEAYLEQGRFMEAMVVCKKGLKAHPTSVEARVLLAQVYARQQKYPRAIQELDELIAGNGQNALAFAGRGKIRLESGDEKGAIADFKKAIDLDDGVEDATEALRKLGIVYPEPPPPPPAAAPAAAMPRMQSYVMPQGPMPPQAMMPGGAAAGQVVQAPPPAAWQTEPQPPGWPLPPPLVRGGSQVAPGYAPGRPRLEGEDELEALANRVGAERQGVGNAAKLSLLLGGFLLITSLVVTAYLFHRKHVTEGIAELSRTARAEFAEDTYGSYKKAAFDFEKILSDFDSKHALTIANLAHTYAILWGEHGETERREALEKLMPLAEKYAPSSAHTISASGLILLYSGQDRHKAAVTAAEAIAPLAKKLRDEHGQGGSYADLTLGIIDLELGNYETAQSTLSEVVQSQPQSVRAKIWYARASQRSGYLDRAESAYSEALRVSKDHPGARAGRALVRVQRGKLQPAAEDLVAFDAFIQQFPKEVSTRDGALAEYARSEIFRAAGEEARASGAYENAVRLDKTNADFPYGLGRVLLAQGRFRDAVGPLGQAVKMEPNRRAFLVALATAELELGDYASAEKHIAAALKLRADDLEALVAKGRLLAAQKKPETEAFLRGVIETTKGAAVVNLELAKYFRASTRAKDARDILEKTINEIDSVPPTVRGQVLLEYGKLMLDNGDEGTAYNSFEKAGEAGAMEGWFRALELLQRGGRRDKEAMKKACDRYLNAGSLPNTSEAKGICAGLL